MSDESKPPPLRLKPRLRPDDPAPANPATPPPAEAQAPERPGSPLPSRPAPEPVAPTGPAENTPKAGGPAPETAQMPESGERAAPPDAEEIPRFKLKAKTLPPDETHAIDLTPSGEEPLEPPPEEPPHGTPDYPSMPAPVVHLKAPEDMDEDKLAAKAAPPVPRKKPQRKLLGLVVGAVVLLGAAGYVWQKLTVLPPPPVLNVHRVAPKPKAPAAPEGALDKIASLPGGMIDRAQEAIANRRADAQAPVDRLAVGQDPAEPRNPPPAVPGKLTTVEAQAQTVIAPGLTATTVTTMSAVEASAAFKSFVANLTINGVFQGTPSRVLINGHTFREGELLEPTLGIVFDHVESARKQIIFKDRSGAIVERGY